MRYDLHLIAHELGKFMVNVEAHIESHPLANAVEDADIEAIFWQHLLNYCNCNSDESAGNKSVNDRLISLVCELVA